MPLGEERRRAVCGRTARTVRGGGGRHQGSVGNAARPECLPPTLHTHMCARNRYGRFKLKRVTSKKKMRVKLKSVKAEMMRRRDLPIPEQGRWLSSVLAGHYRYYAVPDNSEALHEFRRRITRHWRRALSRRS